MTYNEIWDYCMKNGGVTIDPYTLKPVHPKSGYAVSIKGFEGRIPLEFLTREIFNMLLSEYIIKAYHQNLLVGLWVNNGYVYFDLSTLIESYNEAVVLAKKNEQKAIYDFANMKSMEVV